MVIAHQGVRPILYNLWRYDCRMSRPLRIEYPGALYHEKGRGQVFRYYIMVIAGVVSVTDIKQWRLHL